MMQAILFLLIMILSVAIVIAFQRHRRHWIEVAELFKAPNKVSWNYSSNGSIKINQIRYNQLVVIVSKSGLFLSAYGFLPSLLLSGQILIPWSSCEYISEIKKAVLGFKYSEYTLTVNTQTKRVQIVLPRDFALEIIHNQFVPNSD